MAVTIYPEKGNEKFVAEALLALADHPNDVQVDTRGRQGHGSTVGFRVPDYLFKLFDETMSRPAAEGVKTPEAVTVADAEESEPVKPVKRAGRPKKTEVAE